MANINENRVTLKKAFQSLEVASRYKNSWIEGRNKICVEAPNRWYPENSFASGMISGRSDLVQYRDNTGIANQIKQPPRSLPFAKQEETSHILK